MSSNDPLPDADAALTIAARRALPLIDLTSLGDGDTIDDVDLLCEKATTPFGEVAAVCVWSRFVERARQQTNHLGVGVAGVANFPDGNDDPGRAVEDALEIVTGGGTEVDVVYPWKHLRDSGRPSDSGLIKLVRAAIPEDIVLKVILETGELDDPELIRIAALDAVDEGADFLKTSTGKTERSATPDAVRLLCEIAARSDRPIGVKVSGGVRTVADADRYLRIADAVMGADQVRSENFRIGASSLLTDVLEALTAASNGDDSQPRE